jgi:CelD/BcsL family acetyltransferase involved in cellulose biosynthesis
MESERMNFTLSTEPIHTSSAQPAAPRPLSCSIVRTPAEFAALETPWKALFQSTARPVPFLAWEWVTTWWKHFGKAAKLFVILAKDDAGRIVGIAPLQIATRRAFGIFPVRSLEFIGYRGSSVCADHLDFMTASGAPHVPEDAVTQPTWLCDPTRTVSEALLEAVFAARKEWDCIELADLSEESALPSLLNDQARRRKFRLAEGAGQVCPCVPLAPSWTELLKIVKEKKRSAIKWRRKKLLQAYPTQFQIFADPAQVDAALDTLARLHTLSRQRKHETGNFYRADYQAFHRDVARAMARAGYLYIAQMDCDGRPVASTYGFHVGSVLFDYQKGYDPAYSRDGVGSVLTGMVIEDAIERLHAQELDFLRGTEEYKYFWATRDRKTRTILLWSAGVMARLHQGEFDLRRALAPVKRKGLDSWARITAPKPAKKPEAAAPQPAVGAAPENPTSAPAPETAATRSETPKPPAE